MHLSSLSPASMLTPKLRNASDSVADQHLDATIVSLKAFSYKDQINSFIVSERPIVDSEEDTLTLPFQAEASPSELDFAPGSFWFQHTSPLFATLLDRANYPPSLESRYMSFLLENIIPFLRPLPRNSNWSPHLTYNHSPFEPSLNFQSSTDGKLKQQVRFTFEPSGVLSGTDADPFNQLSSLSFVNSLVTSNFIKNLDLK